MSAARQVWPAPAKLNLMLHIVGQRPDGYHLLQTLFQLLDFADELRITLRKDGQILRAAGAAGVAPEDDLVVRAARALQRASGSQLGADIAVTKRIPMGAGLGGGSSDAATTLVALNQLWGLGMTTEALQQVGLALGADVPVFVAGHSAWAEGVGEQLQPVTLPERHFLVVCPACHVSTAEIFSAPELTRETPITTIGAVLGGAGHNDCQPVVQARHKEVAQAIELLAEYGEPRMTGTGAAVFLPVADAAQGQRLLAQLPAQLSGFVAQGVNRSPLLDCISQ